MDTQEEKNRTALDVFDDIYRDMIGFHPEKKSIQDKFNLIFSVFSMYDNGTNDHLAEIFETLESLKRQKKIEISIPD